MYLSNAWQHCCAVAGSLSSFLPWKNPFFLPCVLHPSYLGDFLLTNWSWKGNFSHLWSLQISTKNADVVEMDFASTLNRGWTFVKGVRLNPKWKTLPHEQGWRQFQQIAAVATVFPCTTFLAVLKGSLILWHAGGLMQCKVEERKGSMGSQISEYRILGRKGNMVTELWA